MKIGIIGTGWGARVQVPVFRAAGLELVGIAGRRPEKTRQQAAELDVHACADWRELLASDADLISIVTPPALHLEMAQAALEAGKHVLCEKPTALDAEQAAAMLAAAQAHPSQLALIDHELRFLPLVQEARARIAAGELGEIYHLTASIATASRGDLQRPWDWWSDREQGGGTWGAVGSHQLDLIRYLCGEIRTISASLHTFVRQRHSTDGLRPVTSDDYASTRLELESGALAHATFSAVAAVAASDTLIIDGALGALRIQTGRLELARRGGQWQDIPPAATVPMPDSTSRMYTESMFPQASVYLAHALKAWDAGDHAALAPAATFADGLIIQLLLDAGRRSAAEGGRAVSVVH